MVDINQVQQQAGVGTNIKAINATIMLLSQKISYLVRNEKILSQNILVLNEKLKKLEDKLNSQSGMQTTNGASSEDLDGVKAQISELYNKVTGLKQEIEQLSQNIDSIKGQFVTKKEFQEIKYLVDAINPLEYVTYKQIKDLVKKE